MAVLSIKAQVAEALNLLNEAELQQVADYVAFIRFRARIAPLTPEDEAQLAALYKEYELKCIPLRRSS